MNYFYYLDGKKFPTNSCHAIWVQDLIRQYPPEVIRWHLCAKGPEWQIESFSMYELTSKTKTSFMYWQVWFNQINNMLQDFERIVPDVGLWDKHQRYYYNQLKTVNCNIFFYYRRQIRGCLW